MPADGLTDSELIATALQPFTLKNLTLRNRLVRTSTGLGFTPAGEITGRLITYYLARARGEIGTLYADPASVHWSSPGYINLRRDETIEGLARLVDAVHAEGAKVFEQLMHNGASIIPGDGTSPWAASNTCDPGLNMVSQEMTKSMIDEVVEGYAAAAYRAKQAGIDAVEVHGGHGYLPTSFLSPVLNRRTDEYGGDLKARTRFLREVLAAIRARVGPEQVVGVRLSADGVDGHTSTTDIGNVARMLEREGLIDYLSLSLGSHFRYDLMVGGAHMEPGYQIGYYGTALDGFGLPKIVAGRITSVARAGDIIRRGQADLVAITRATIADPDIVRKTRLGDAHRVRPCIACDQACIGGLNTRGWAGCAVNPGAGREAILGDDRILRADEPSRVVVVGGGPAGLEAARVSAAAGHAVALLEAADSLGGQLAHTRNSVHRRLTADILAYLASEIRLAGVEIRLGRKASVEDIVALAPDFVILATGSTPRRDGLQTFYPGPPQGWTDASLLTSWDVMSGVTPGEVVLVLDEVGHYEAIDVLEKLIADGHAVVHVTKHAMVSPNLEMRYGMIGSPHVSMLLKGPYRAYYRSVLVGVGDGTALVAPIEAMTRACEVPFDALVALNGNVPTVSLVEPLEQRGLRVVRAGDVNGPRFLEAAITEGQLAARSLDPGFVRPTDLRYGQQGSV